MYSASSADEGLCLNLSISQLLFHSVQTFIFLIRKKIVSSTRIVNFSSGGTPNGTLFLLKFA